MVKSIVETHITRSTTRFIINRQALYFQRQDVCCFASVTKYNLKSACVEGAIDGNDYSTEMKYRKLYDRYIFY